MTDDQRLAGNENRDFASYEYKEILADEEKASFLLDGYKNFGWEQDENLLEVGHLSGQRKVLIHLKRNRKIINKTELTRLQRNFEACVKEIAAMENAKVAAPTACALFIGILGTVFIIGAVFAMHSVIGCILFAVPGLAGWIAPYFVYKRWLQKKEERLMPLIETKYNEIYEICEKGHKLIS